MKGTILKKSLILIIITSITIILSMTTLKILNKNDITTQITQPTLQPNQEIVYDYVEEKTFGIDVSKYQEDIDWAKVKQSGVEFAMIRVGFRGYEDGKIYIDDYFEKNINGAINNDIQVGIYFYSSAKTEKEAREEAKWVINKINPYKQYISYPVAFDLEDFNKYRLKGITNNKLSKNAEAFLEVIENNNYIPSIYSCNLPLKHIWSKKIKEKYKVWLAQYDNNIDINYDMVQYTSKGKINGIKGNVDLNYANFKFIKRIVDINDPNEQVIKNTKITQTNDYVTTTTFANFRKAPTFELDNILTESLKPNTKLKRLGITDNDWSKVEYNGQIGYIYNYYLSK